jgi:hypothetical protein
MIKDLMKQDVTKMLEIKNESKKIEAFINYIIKFGQVTYALAIEDFKEMELKK